MPSTLSIAIFTFGSLLFIISYMPASPDDKSEPRYIEMWGVRIPIPNLTPGQKLWFRRFGLILICLVTVPYAFSFVSHVREKMDFDFPSLQASPKASPTTSASPSVDATNQSPKKTSTPPRDSSSQGVLDQFLSLFKEQEGQSTVEPADTCYVTIISSRFMKTPETFGVELPRISNNPFSSKRYKIFAYQETPFGLPGHRPLKIDGWCQISDHNSWGWVHLQSIEKPSPGCSKYFNSANQ